MGTKSVFPMEPEFSWKVTAMLAANGFIRWSEPGTP